MRRRVVLAVACCAAVCASAVAPAAPTAAGQRRAEPLAATPPAPGARVVDRVVDGAAPERGPRARAAQSGERRYVTADGHTVAVRLSGTYVADDAVARSYVDFLASLEHGDELGRLRILIATPAEIPRACGADDGAGVLACYLPTQDLIVVPGEEIAAVAGGATTAYVVAHEYGHHVANHRSNAPFPSLDFGPKRWASHEDVCTQTLDGRLAPGDEATFYRQNPGEAWAEAYAQLRFPLAGWNFTDLLRPTAASFAEARRDVAEPWTGPRTRTFRGRLGARDRTDRFRFRLRLDGELSVQLHVPRGADYDLAISSGGTRHGATRASGSGDRLRFDAACVEEPETVTVTVTRRSGAGAYRVVVSYAG